MKKNFISLLLIVFLISGIFVFNGCGTQYSITVDSGIIHGQITVSKTKAKAGDEITITATPEEGYYLNIGTLKANDKLIVDYTFEMPSKDVVIYAEFVLPGKLSLTAFFDIEEINQILQEDYINKPNTNNGDVQIVEVDSNLESNLYTSFLAVENPVIKINNNVLINETITISLGNNRFFELPLFKQQSSIFSFLTSALVEFAQNGQVELYIGEKGYDIYLDFQANYDTAINHVLLNTQEITVTDNEFDVNFQNDLTLQIGLEMYDENVTGDYVAYSNLVLNFTDNTSKVVHVFGNVTNGTYELNLLYEFLPQDKTLSDIQVYAHFLEFGFLNFTINNA